VKAKGSKRELSGRQQNSLSPGTGGEGAHSSPFTLHALLGAALTLFAAALRPAHAEDALTLVLNWTPGAEHAPFFFAHDQGWYARAGIALNIEPVLGSPGAARRAAGEARSVAVADFVSVLRGQAQGVDVTAVLVLQPVSPWAFYFSEGGGVAGPSDFPGKRLAAQSQDPMRALWSVLAKRAGVDPGAVHWIEMANAAKPEALARREIDVALNPFLHNHLSYRKALGERMRVSWWHDLGFAAYGHVLVAGPALIDQDPDLLRRFVQVTQQAWSQCLATPQPCIDALGGANRHLDAAEQREVWDLVLQLARKDSNRGDSAGAFDQERVMATWRDLRSAFGLSELSGPKTSNVFLSPQRSNQ
jgi:NitT/TauT family transport system substrate-binding protein